MTESTIPQVGARPYVDGHSSSFSHSKKSPASPSVGEGLRYELRLSCVSFSVLLLTSYSLPIYVVRVMTCGHSVRLILAPSMAPPRLVLHTSGPRDFLVLTLKQGWSRGWDWALWIQVKKYRSSSGSGPGSEWTILRGVLG